jgi:hypothetical protein
MANADDRTHAGSATSQWAQLVVAEQKALIDRLKALQRDTTGAERLLHSFEDQLRRLTVRQHVS